MVTPDKLRILILTHQNETTDWLRALLKQTGFKIDEIHEAHNLDSALHLLKSGNVTNVFIDSNFVLQDVFKNVRCSFSQAHLIVICENPGKEDLLNYLRLGANDVLDRNDTTVTELTKALLLGVERSGYVKLIREKEEEYKMLFDNNPNPLMVWDAATMKIIKVNEAAEKFYDCKKEEFCKKHMSDLFEPAFYNSNREQIQDKLKHSNRLVNMVHMTCATCWRYVDMDMKDLNMGGKSLRIAMVKDVTDNQFAIQKLLQSELQLRKLAENYPNGAVFIVDQSYNILLAEGKELNSLIGENPVLIGQKITILPGITDLVTNKNILEDVFNNKQVVQEIIVKDQVYQVSATGIINNEGMTDRAILVIQNISFNIAATNEILFQAGVLSNVMEAVMVQNPEGKIIYCNEGATKMFGYEAGELLGKQTGIILSRDHTNAEFYAMRQQVLKHGKITLEREAFKKDGSRLIIESRLSLMPGAQGKSDLIVSVARDITHRVEAEKVLKESEANLQAIFQSTSQSFLLMDTEFRIVAFNKNTSDSFKKFYNIHLMPGDYYTDYLLDDRRRPFRQSMERVLNKEIVKFEERFDFPEEHEVYIEATYSPVISDGKVIGIILCAENTTEKIRAKNAIIRSEEKYRGLVETAIDLIWTVNDEGKVVFVNQASLQILGITPEELKGTYYLDLVVPDDRERVQAQFMNMLQTHEGYSNFECRVNHKNGEEIYLLTNAVVQQAENSRQKGILLTGTSRNITARVKVENELNEKNEQLRMLSNYLQTVREEERTHIAREIHDELGQQLTGLKMDLAWINRKTGDSNGEIKKILTGTMKLVDDTIKNVRKISSDLRPGILDDLGLVAAIEWYCIEFNKKTGITYNLDINVNDVTIDKDSATSVFRIFQETMTNIARHSEATSISVEFYRIEHGYRLLISDNGKGFKTDPEGKQKTLGLLGMRERAVMLNGSLNIRSTPGKGTETILEFPESIEVTESE